MEQIIVFMRINILKERNVFWRRMTKFCDNFSQKQKLQFLLLSDIYNLWHQCPMFSTYRVQVEQIILYVTIVNWYFERKECSSTAPVPKFWHLGVAKFVLASELNLSLATGLASWKVSLKPWILERQKCISATSTCTDGSRVTAWNKTHHLVRSYIV